MLNATLSAGFVSLSRIESRVGDELGASCVEILATQWKKIYNQSEAVRDLMSRPSQPTAFRFPDRGGARGDDR